MSADTNNQLPPDGDSPDDLQTLAGQYVLGTQDAAQRRAIEDRLAHDPELRAAVDAWEQRLQPLTTLAPPQEPSTGLWPRITASLWPAVATHRAAAPAGSAARSRWWHWDSLALWRGLAGSGFAAAAVLTGVLVLGDAAAPAPARYFVVLAAPQSQAPGWLVQAQASDRLRLVPWAPMWCRPRNPCSSGPRPMAGAPRYRWASSSRVRRLRCPWTSCHRCSPTSCLS